MKKELKELAVEIGFIVITGVAIEAVSTGFKAMNETRKAKKNNEKVEIEFRNNEVRFKRIKNEEKNEE